MPPTPFPRSPGLLDARELPFRHVMALVSQIRTCLGVDFLLTPFESPFLVLRALGTLLRNSSSFSSLRDAIDPDPLECFSRTIPGRIPGWVVDGAMG